VCGAGGAGGGPRQEQRVIDWLERKAHWPEARCSNSGSWFVARWSARSLDFFTRYGRKLAILILAFIASYRSPTSRWA